MGTFDLEYVKIYASLSKTRSAASSVQHLQTRKKLRRLVRKSRSMGNLKKVKIEQKLGSTVPDAVALFSERQIQMARIAPATPCCCARTALIFSGLVSG